MIFLVNINVEISAQIIFNAMLPSLSARVTSDKSLKFPSFRLKKQEIQHIDLALYCWVRSKNLSNVEQ